MPVKIVLISQGTLRSFYIEENLYLYTVLLDIVLDQEYFITLHFIVAACSMRTISLEHKTKKSYKDYKGISIVL